MADITVQTISRSGLEATYQACAGGGDKFVNTGVEFIHIKNVDVADKTLTMALQATVDGQSVAAKTVVITAGEERLVGPFPTAYNDSQSKVNLTYSAVTSLTIAVLKLSTS